MGALLLALGLAILDWIAVATGRRKAEYVLKPLVMVALIAAAFVIEPLPSPVEVLGDHAFYFVVAALVLSLMGDVFLMLPTDRFVQGLLAFLLAHLCYIAAFARSFGQVETVVVAVVVTAVSGVLYSRMRSAMVQRGHERLIAPVTVYVVVISLMVAAAVGTKFVEVTLTSPILLLVEKGWSAWGPVVGGVLFYISDAMIGWSRFVRDFPHSRLAVMVTYHLGQIGLVMAVAFAR